MKPSASPHIIEGHRQLALAALFIREDGRARAMGQICWTAPRADRADRDAESAQRPSGSSRFHAFFELSLTICEKKTVDGQDYPNRVSKAALRECRRLRVAERGRGRIQHQPRDAEMIEVR